QLRLDSRDAETALSAPGSLRLPPGPHRLYLEADGFAPQQLEARVPPEGEVYVPFRLLPLPPPTGALVVRANVDGALVRVDGKEAGFTPAVIDVRAGLHEVQVLADGREPFTAKVAVPAEERVPVEV